MNTCILSGRLEKNAVVKNTQKVKVLSFVVETIYGYNGEQKRDLVACVLFKPSPELEALLVGEGQGLYVELEGRVSSSVSQTQGERRFNSDVIVRGRTLAVQDHPEVSHGTA